MPLDRYRAVMRLPHVARLLTTSLVARMPNGMAGLAILLLVTRHNGYGRAGVVTGVFVAAAGVSNLLLARAADRWGPRRVLFPAACGYAGGMLALALVPGDLYVAELALAVVAGSSAPPVVSVVRGMWPRLLAPDEAQVVYGLEATAQELIFIAGPALVALVAATAGAPAAVIATGLFAFAGTVAFIGSPAIDRPAVTARRARHRLMRDTELPMFVGLAVSITLAFNMVDVGVVAFVSGRHATPAAGIVLAVWGIGSLLGGLLFGAGRRAVDDFAVVRAVLAMALAVAVTALSPGRIGLGALLFVGGATVAPGLARLYARVGAIAPQGAATEAFGWIAVGLLTGASVGAAVGGWAVESVGARADLAFAALPPALAASAVGLRLRRRAPVMLASEPLPS